MVDDSEDCPENDGMSLTGVSYHAANEGRGLLSAVKGNSHRGAAASMADPGASPREGYSAKTCPFFHRYGPSTGQQQSGDRITIRMLIRPYPVAGQLLVQVAGWGERAAIAFAETLLLPVSTP